MGKPGEFLCDAHIMDQIVGTSVLVSYSLNASSLLPVQAHSEVCPETTKLLSPAVLVEGLLSPLEQALIRSLAKLHIYPKGETSHPCNMWGCGKMDAPFVDGKIYVKL